MENAAVPKPKPRRPATTRRAPRRRHRQSKLDIIKAAIIADRHLRAVPDGARWLSALQASSYTGGISPETLRQHAREGTFGTGAVKLRCGGGRVGAWRFT